MWTEERVETLKTLWATGESASRIAAQLGGFAHCQDAGRSAVIGKVHRLGLSGRATHYRKPTVQRKRASRPDRRVLNGAKPKIEKAKLQTPLQRLDIDPAEIEALLNNPSDTARVSFEALDHHHCKWPVGDPRTTEFGFCGRNHAPGLPYCPEHALRASGRHVPTPTMVVKQVIKSELRAFDNVAEFVEA